MSNTALPFISADDVFARVSFADAVRAYHRDLKAGLDPSKDLPKHIEDVTNGQVLLMPTQSPEYLGVKIVTVAPDNPDQGLERIQGHYLLFDTATLSPVAIMDGVALTTLRTPAVSAAAADLLAAESCDHLLIFGYGPQAWGHVEALRAIRDIKRVTLVARNRDRAQVFADQITATGIPASVGTVDDVQDADIIVCATTAREPLFDGALVPTDSCVIAVGSHELDARELDTALIARSQVIVEDLGHVMKEGGDIVIPVNEGAITLDHVRSLRDLVTGQVTIDRTRPRVFKSSGMPWEDLVVAAEVFRHS